MDDALEFSDVPYFTDKHLLIVVLLFYCFIDATVEAHLRLNSADEP